MAMRRHVAARKEQRVHQRTIKLVSWNVNGFRAIAAKGFSAWLQASGADIVMLQETKCHPDQLTDAHRSPPGYQSEWCSAEKKGYSGVATFMRAPVAATAGIGAELFDREGRVLISELPHFTLYNVYFPSGSAGPERVTYKLAFYQHLLGVLRAQIAAGRSIVVAGDVNTAYAPIDLARPRENQKTSGFLPEERAALGEFFAAGLVDSFRHHRPDDARYSWWSQVTNARARNIGWRLDYFLVSRDLAPAIVDADIHSDVLGSDHCPVSLTLELPGA
jgi:exodeoxyribonuclease III